MNSVFQMIERQIKNCEELLSLFLSERRTYQDRTGEVQVDEVMEFMRKKQQLVGIFDNQNELRDLASEMNETEQKDYKKRLRELATLLEQLLVIDQENEKLLRTLLSRQNLPPRPIGAVGPAMVERDHRQRPALVRQLPFCPGVSAGKPSFKPIERPAVVTRAAEEKPVLPPSSAAPVAKVPRSRLRQYAAASGALAAQYA